MKRELPLENEQLMKNRSFSITVMVLGALILAAFSFHCGFSSEQDKPSEQGCLDQKNTPSYQVYFSENPEYIAQSFDFPVGIPDAKGYYNAQGFGENNHLGDDWNGVGGGNTDLGDPVFSVANGWISHAYDAGAGWGNVVRVIHQLENGETVESLYAHLNEIQVIPFTGISKGERIGTIGNADGAYLAHLHLELRDSIEMPLGGGYSLNKKGYLDPSEFIRIRR